MSSTATLPLIQRYQLTFLEECGKGGCSAIRRVLFMPEGKAGFIKAVAKTPDLEGIASEDFDDPFEAEEALEAQISHEAGVLEELQCKPGSENIVKILGYYKGSSTEKPAIILEPLLAGEGWHTLGDYFYQTRGAPSLTFAERLEIAIKLAEGLIAVHEAGYIPADFNPDNVMVRKKHGFPLEVRIIDLANAKKIDEQDEDEHYYATVPYAVPEHVFRNMRNRAHDKATQFLSGLVYSMALFGVHPYLTSEELNVYNNSEDEADKGRIKDAYFARLIKGEFTKTFINLLETENELQTMAGIIFEAVKAIPEERHRNTRDYLELVRSTLRTIYQEIITEKFE